MHRFSRTAMAYLLAVLLGPLGLLLIQSMSASWRGRLLVVVIFVPILIATWLGGRRPGLLAIVITTTASLPIYWAGLHSTREWTNYLVSVTVYLTFGTLLTLLISGLQSARHRVESEGHVRREAELRAIEARLNLAAIVESSDDAIISKNLDGMITSWNQGAEKLYGYSAKEAVGKPITIVVPPNRSDELRWIMERLNRGERVEHLETQRICKDGSCVEVSLVISPIRRADDRVIGASTIARDITASKEADRRKNEFLALLAHELRNPLAPLRSGLEIMKLAKNDPEAAESARAMMERQLQQLSRLVDDLLDVSRISRGTIELRKEHVALAEAVGTAVETCKPLIEQAGHTLTITLSDQPVSVYADKTRMAQILANLLSNAAKYTQPGGQIWLTLESDGRDAVIRVKDTGIGIPAAMLPKVFELFTQVDRSLEKAQSGLGVGLTIVHRLVEMHGGTVEAHSEGHGRGSEFIIRLPADPSLRDRQPSADDDQRNRPVTARRILVVDDNEDAATSMAMMLQMMGNKVQTANDGLAAVDVAGEFRPDIILLDIGMPILNGYDACRRIREQPWGKELFIVAVTGWGKEEDRARSKEAGFDSHLVKPLEPTALQNLLAEIA